MLPLPALLAAARAAALQPRLRLLSASPLDFVLPAGGSASFEGGTVLRDDAGLHLFTTDTSRGLNTSLVYYRARPRSERFAFIRQLVCCSTGRADGRSDDDVINPWC